MHEHKVYRKISSENHLIAIIAIMWPTVFLFEQVSLHVEALLKQLNYCTMNYNQMIIAHPRIARIIQGCLLKYQYGGHKTLATQSVVIRIDSL